MLSKDEVFAFTCAHDAAIEARDAAESALNEVLARGSDTCKVVAACNVFLAAHSVSVKTYALLFPND